MIIQSSPIEEMQLVTLVDETDRVLGSLDRVAAHQGEGVLHRAASIFLFRKNQTGEIEVLLQQRSPHKIVAPNLWANTACGNCRPKELPLACIQRRLREELGLTGIQPTPITEFVYQVKCEPGWSEFEYDHLFAGWYNEKLAINQAEVQQVVWVKWERLLNNLSGIESEYALTPWVPLFLSLPKVVSGLISWLD